MDLDSTQEIILRIGLLIVACTLLITASFIGVIAAFTGEIGEFQNRIPWYMVAAATMFVATIILLELNNADGKTIIVSAIFTGIVSFILVFFGIEGVLYAIANPAAVFDSRLVIYFLSAALVATGFGYWGLRHWREFTPEPPEDTPRER